MGAVLAILRGIPLLVYPLVLVCGLWLYERHEHKAANDRYAAHIVEDEKATVEANRLANMSALRFEERRMALKAKTVTVTRTIHEAIASAPAWGNQPIDSGVLDALRAAEAVAGVAASQSDGGLRPPVADKPEDKRPIGGGLRGSLGRLFGVSREAPGSSGSPP